MERSGLAPRVPRSANEMGYCYLAATKRSNELLDSKLSRRSAEICQVFRRKHSCITLWTTTRLDRTSMGEWGSRSGSCREARLNVRRIGYGRTAETIAAILFLRVFAPLVKRARNHPAQGSRRAEKTKRKRSNRHQHQGLSTPEVTRPSRTARRSGNVAPS